MTRKDQRLRVGLAVPNNSCAEDRSGMSIGNWLIMRTLRPASGLRNAVNNDLSGWIRVLPAGPFSASRHFPFVLNAGFIDSASAQKRSGRSLFFSLFFSVKELEVIVGV